MGAAAAAADRPQAPKRIRAKARPRHALARVAGQSKVVINPLVEEAQEA